MRRLQVIEPGEAAHAPAGGALKIAFATQDLRRVDAHFGSAPALVIYEVGPTDYRFLEAVQFDAVSNQNGIHLDDADGEDRIGAKVAALTGCALLFSLAIGGVAAARVVNNRVYPLKLPQPEAIADVIGRVQAMMNGTPPPWMRKILQQGDSNAFLDE
jgi:nitrogen fixation protein NifX